MPHPDEGLIHAWLDGQLPPDDAARVEQLAATDPAWAEAVAEARGLVAASSRILAALDHVPAGVIPQGMASRSARRLPWWTKAAAAVVLVTGGSMLVMQRAETPTLVNAPAMQESAARAVQAPAVVERPAVPAMAAAPATASALASGNRPARAARTNEAKVSVQAAPESISVASPLQRTAAALSQPPAAMQMNAAPAAPAQGMPSPAPLALRNVAPTPPVAESLRRETQARDVARRASREVSPREVVLDQVVVAGAPAQKSAAVGGLGASAARAGACYGVRDANVPSDAGIVMRVVRTDGDTLHLEPMRGGTSLRAWVVWRDGVARGAMSAAPDARGAVPVVATPAACPAP